MGNLQWIDQLNRKSVPMRVLIHSSLDAGKFLPGMYRNIATEPYRTSMKAIILAGGLGSRLAEETSARPKPMVEIGGQPILWHIMKIYSHYGINDFIVCLGYKGYMIKEFFANYFLHSADVTIDLQQNKIETHSANCEPWRVTLVDTGDATMTGGRLKRALAYVKKDEDVCFTYGDGLADINLDELLEFHRSRKTLVTLT